MSASPCLVLTVTAALPDLANSAFGPFVMRPYLALEEVSNQLQNHKPDILLIDLAQVGGLERLAQWPALSRAVFESALLVLADQPSPETCLHLLQLGVREILCKADLEGPLAAERLGRMLRLTRERKRLDDLARRAHSIDLATGLPNQQQLLEHMSHLLALREREPAAMALIALQLDGFEAAQASLGAETANVLRRKAAVRLRASLRASDVVASLGNDCFAVLLAWIDNNADGERVAQKLLKAISQPFQVGGQAVPVGARIGVSQYPQHGKEAAALLQRAVNQTSGEGLSRVLGAGSPAANDESATIL